MKNEVKIDPITIIGESNKKLPNVNTALGRKQAKFYRDRILNGEMSFDAVPKNYRGAVQNYLKSVPIENKARERHGYEGLNNFMYSVSGGVPGLVIDYINKIVGSVITTLKGNSKNIFDSSNKGIAEIITDNFREKHPTVSNVIDVGLNTIPGILLSKYIPDTTIGSTNLNSTDIKIDKSGLKRAYFTQRRNDTPFVKAILKKANKSSVKDLSKQDKLLLLKLEQSQIPNKLKEEIINKYYYIARNNFDSVSDIILSSNTSEISEKTKRYIDNYINTTLEKDYNNHYKSILNDLYSSAHSNIHENLMYVWNTNNKNVDIDKLNSLLNDDVIKQILYESPDYSTTIINHAINNEYDIENTIKDLIRQKHRFIRGFKSENDPSILENYSLGFAPDTGGGRSDAIRVSNLVGSNYRSNSLETAYAYSKRNAFNGDSFIALIETPENKFDFSGDYSTWWNKNKLFIDSNPNLDPNEISVTKAVSTRVPYFKGRLLDFNSYIRNKLFGLLGNNESYERISRINKAYDYLIKNMPENIKKSPAISIRDISDDIPLRHIIFEGPVNKKIKNEQVKFINTTNLSLEDIENMFNINLDIHANTTKHRGKGEYLFSLGNRYGGFINNINNRRRYNFGGIRSTHDATADYLGMARDSGNRFFGNGIIDMLYHGGTNDDTGIPVKNYVDKLIANDKLIYANMQNKINNEVLTSRGITAKFGGLVGIPRRKFYWGGTSINDPGSVQWGTRVQASDIDESKYSADGEGIVGGSALSGAGTGLGIGAAVGGTAALATGAAAGSWLGPIGAGIGALIGGIVGLFTGRKKKRQEERRRQELLAEQAEMERQQTLGNMQDKVENDVATIRQSNLGNYSEGTGFYAKLGGMIGRRKLNTGGQVVPNSSNTVVAYGQTHEQYNPATGETGIIYGDSEIEGGGAKNGRMYAGEVVRETPEGGQVFSDTIKVPGTNRTFADYAKKLTDMKGEKEHQVIQLADGITLSLSALDKSKTNKLQTGTNVRNIEKLVYRMNKARGESEAIDAKTEDLFEAQELYATALGLRNDATVMRCGGMVRKKRPFGGYASPYSLTGVSAPKLTTLPPIQTTASAGGGSAFKFGFNEFGLGMNLASSLFGIVGNALNTRANRKAIEFESTLHVPKGNKVDAVQYSTDYDISEELQELDTQERRAARYITDNTSNVQTARNSVANLAINAQLARNKLYGAKKDYQRQRYDLNRQERINAQNANNQIMYQDAINEYNKAVGLNQQLMAVRTQGLQGMLQGIEGLAGAVNNYASARLYEKLWPRGVTNHMRSGFACGGLARRKRA
jgi:hypothetical protein